MKSEEMNLKTKKEGLGTLSMIFGIISIVLSLIINILVLPLAISGLIIGIVNKVQKGKKFSGIILNIIAIIISFISLFVLIFVILKYSVVENSGNVARHYSNTNDIVGTWECEKSDSLYDEELILKFNNDKTYTIWKNHNTYQIGTYSLDKNKELFNKLKFSFFKLYPLEEHENNILNQNDDSKYTTYNFMVNGLKKNTNAYLSNEVSNALYVCNKE